MAKQKLLLVACLFALVAYSSCGLDCIDKKTGMHKSSETMQTSRENGVFQFEMLCDKRIIPLGRTGMFKIRRAWVENNWRYECVNNTAVVTKDSSLQLVIDGNYTNKVDTPVCQFFLISDSNSAGECFESNILDFPYYGANTMKLRLIKKGQTNHDAIVVDSIKFFKNQP